MITLRAARLRLAMVALSLWCASQPAVVQAEAGARVLAAPLVRLPFPQEDGSLTPYTFELGYQLLTLVYDTLLWRDIDGVAQPWLASAVEPSGDGRRITVHLREGARWHDGAAVTSADVAFTFGYVALHRHPRFTAEVSSVERVDTPDPRTAVILLSEPDAGFFDQPLADLPILPMHLWQNLPKGQLAPDGLAVGSGPYRLVEHVPGQRYRFEANPQYFRGRPSVGAIEVPIITSAEETVKALQRRNVDMIPVSLPSDMAARVDDAGVKVDEGPSYLGITLLFNLRSPPFDRLEVRQAVAAALDLGRISRTIGQAVPAERGYLHPASPYASPVDLHRLDVPAARSVLAGLAGTITILVPVNDPVKAEAAHQVVQALRGAGAQADVAELPGNELSRAVGEDGAAPSFQAAIRVSPALASYDPSFLSRLFGPDQPTGSFNYAGYRSPAFDQAAKRAAAAPDPATRRMATGDVLRILASDAPGVPLFFARGAFAYRTSIYDGWTFVKGSGILDKQSFLAPKSASALPPVPDRAAIPAARPAPEGLSIAGVMAIAVLALAGALGLALAVCVLRDRWIERR